MFDVIGIRRDDLGCD